MAIYDRLPQSLKQEESLRDGSIVEGLEPSVSNDGYLLSISSGKIFWDSTGIVEVPEFRIDGNILSALPGEYIVGLGNRPVAPPETLTVDSVLSEEYLVTIKGLFTDIDFRPENLYFDRLETFYQPGVANATVSIEAEGGGKFTSLTLETEDDVVYNAATYSPTNGSVVIPINNLSSVTLTFPSETTSVSTLRVSGELVPRDPEVLQNSSNVSLYLQPVGRDVLEEIPESRANLALVKYKRDKRVEVIRTLGERHFQLDVTKYITKFWDDQLTEAYRKMFYYVPDYLDPFTAYKKEYDI